MATGLTAHFVAMAGNNAWANHRLLTACRALSPEAFAAPRTGFFPSLRATLNHILWVDRYYIDALHRDRAHAMPSGTGVKPPQLDEFFLAGEEDLQRDELRLLGLPER